MVAAGILQDDEPYELIGGDLVAMAPKNRRHEVLRTELHAMLARRCPSRLKIAAETPLHLTGGDAPEPDIIVYPARLKAPDVGGGDVVLVIECADTSLSWDLGRKAALYASASVVDYWVINANTHVTTVHRDPTVAGFGVVSEHPPGATLVPLLAPELAVRLADLDLE